MKTDETRTKLAADIARRFADPEFHALLSVAPDGTSAVIPALRSDVVSDVLSEVAKAGGTANAVVPVANGYLIIAIKLGGRSHKAKSSGALEPTCTMGVLIARMFEDGATEGHLLHYSIGDGSERRARADLVGLAL